MTSTTLSYLNVIGAVACFIVPTWQLITNTQRQGLRRITTIGWICFAIALYIIWVSVSSINAVNREKRQSDKIADSIRTADKKEIIDSFRVALKERNLYYDSANNRVRDADKNDVKANPINEEPLLLVSSGAKFADETANNIQIQFTVKNYQKGIANNLKLTAVTLRRYNNSFHVYPSTELSMSKNLSLLQNMEYAFSLTYANDGNITPNDTAIVYTRIDYTNPTNLKKHSLRLMLRVPFPKVGNIIADADLGLYNVIKDTLLNRKLW